MKTIYSYFLIDNRLFLKVIILWATLCTAVAKQKSWKEFLTDQLEDLKGMSIECALKSLTYQSLDNLRFSGKSDKARLCYLKFILDHENDSWAMSVLADLYVKLGDAKSRTVSSRIFKEAIKHGNAVSPFVKQWSFIGPFTIGKLEVDGDPLAFYGGIHNVSQHRFKKKYSLPSELVAGGSVNWQQYKQQTAKDAVTISPSVNWNDLINSLDSTAVTEWQGWVVGEFAVNQKDANVMIQCLGVHTIFINGMPVVGDVYMRKSFWFSVSLVPGIHTIDIRIRAKGYAQFACQMKTTESTFQILVPHYLPDIYEGSIFGSYIALPMANHHTTQWLKGIRVAVFSQSEGSTLDVEVINDKKIAIAPGQVAPVLLKLVRSDGHEHVADKCDNIELQLKVKTSLGVGVHTLQLRCRTLRQSFLYTFLDHDGSVQRAAAVHPQRDCANDLCPVLLTLHGTTVPPENQADSYKYKETSDEDYIFGAKHAWLIAPSRHGAHNWEGPGALTAMAAVNALQEIVARKSWISQKLSPEHIVFAGHSMGGHGAWHLSTHYPDRALAVVSLAGWISKEYYGDSNLFFRHDVSTANVDPAVKSIMESCIAENDADRHASNLKGVPVLIRIGANDRTVHPYFTRRMHRVLLEWGVNATYSEVKNLEHWWWDTVETNDGGAVNDKQIRDFTDAFSIIPAETEGTCKLGSECDVENPVVANRYKSRDETFLYTLVNPAFGESYKGIRILQQDVPFVMSSVDAHLEGDAINLKTVNVRRMMISEPLIRPVGWMKLLITIDGSFSARTRITNDKPLCVLKMKGQWEIQQDCDTFETHQNRGPATYGPARRVAESKFLIVVGQSGKYQRELLHFAVYIANLFFLTSDTSAAIVKDTDLAPEEAEMHNLIIIGGPSENLLSQTYLKSTPLSIVDGYIQLGSCTFRESNTGALFLAPHADKKLALVLMANSLLGLQDVVSLAAPTIPPMTRSPFSNLLPDFVITGPNYQSKGPGGYLCAGFWGNNWEFLPGRSSCIYC